MELLVAVIAVAMWRIASSISDIRDAFERMSPPPKEEE